MYALDKYLLEANYVPAAEHSSIGGWVVILMKCVFVGGRA